MADAFLSTDDMERLTGVGGRIPVDNFLGLTLHDLRCRSRHYFIGNGGDDPGVYFLFYGVSLLYVGRSVDVGARLRAHFINRIDRKTRVIPFNKFAAIEVPELLLSRVEVHYIRALLPTCNTIYAWR